MAALAAGAAAPAAIGVGSSGVKSVSVLQLQSAGQLPQTPSASVPVPAVPQAPVEVPDVPVPQAPDVQAPSAPEVSTPQVQAPQAPGVSAPSVPSTSQGATAPGVPGGAPAGSQAAGSGGDASSTGGGDARERAAAARSPRDRASIRRRREVRERRVRRTVRRLSGCLDAIGQDESRLLSLRAGIDGPARSRGDAARELGISRGEAARLERRGLRSLRSAEESGCASGGSSYAQARTVSAVSSGEMPALQPTSLLAENSGARPLVAQERLGRRGKQEVGGVEESSDEVVGDHPESSPTPATASSEPLAAASTTPGGVWIAVGLGLMTLGLLTLLAVRGMSGNSRTGTAGAAPSLSSSPAPSSPPAATIAPMAAGAAAAATAQREERAEPEHDEPTREPEPRPEPEARREPAATAPAAAPAGPPAGSEPASERRTVVTPAPAPGKRGRDYGRVTRPAAIAASGALSFVAREIMRRRGRGRRKR